MDQGKAVLEGYLNRRMRVVISDGRVIDGNFVCTDRDRNMVLGNCEEFFSTSDVPELESSKEAKMTVARTLGLAIIPGEHIVSISVAKPVGSMK
ncbi:hypothetical protein EMCRGX_G016201 [Ephydatia muelleri]